MSDDKKYQLTGAARYGNYYWGVKTNASSDGEIYLHADKVGVGADGSLRFYQIKDTETHPTFMLAAGMWSAVYAASVLDGRPVAAEHWQGEV